MMNQSGPSTVCLYFGDKVTPDEQRQQIAILPDARELDAPPALVGPQNDLEWFRTCSFHRYHTAGVAGE
jgi:hypothetical protein